MPLVHGKSKKAFEKNVKVEESNTGKEHRAQNLAIAYSVQRKAKKKMAAGGFVKDDQSKEESMKSESPAMKSLGSSSIHNFSKDDGSKKLDRKSLTQESMDTESEHSKPEAMDHEDDDRLLDQSMAEESPEMGHHYADHETDDQEKSESIESESPPHDEHYASIADAIMAKAKSKRFADGGMVDIEENEEPEYESEDEENGVEHASRFGEHMEDKSQPMDSNEHGDLLDSDDHDMIDTIRRKIMAKRGR